MSRPEFDNFAATCEQLLKHPIRDYFKRNAVDTKRLSYLDVGCGKLGLMSLRAADFGRVARCDPSGGMLEALHGVDVRVRRSFGFTPTVGATLLFSVGGEYVGKLYEQSKERPLYIAARTWNLEVTASKRSAP